MNTNLLEALSSDPGIPADLLTEARKLKPKGNEKLSDILLQKKIVTEPQLLKTFSTLYDLPFWPDLSLNSIQSELSVRVPIHFLKKHLMVPLRANAPAGDTAELANSTGNAEPPDEVELIVATNRPFDLLPIDDLLYPNLDFCQRYCQLFQKELLNLSSRRQFEGPAGHGSGILV